MTFDFSEFKNKKIIVTGSSTGIGFETGVEFLNFCLLYTSDAADE